MKHLLNAIKVIKDCCTRREELEESNYKQLLDLLPLSESYEIVNERNLHILKKDIPLSNIKLKLFDKNKNRQNILNTNVKITEESWKKEDSENESFIKNRHEDLLYKKKKLNSSIIQENFLYDIDKNNENCSNSIIKENVIKNLKEKEVSSNIYCAHGKLSDRNAVEKNFKLKKIEIIPKFEKKENIMNSFSVVCMRGNQNEYYKSKNNNDYIYFNNYEQYFFIQAYELKIAGIISGTGKNSVSVCDNIVFHLLKTILRNLKNVYENKRNIWLSDQIEYILLSSINDTNNYIKINLQESFNSGCSLCVCAYSKKHELLTILNIGNIQTILVKNIDGKKKEDTKNHHISNALYETILITKKHDVLNKEEKERILSYGCIINDDSENENKNTWKNIDYLNKFNEKNDLKTLNITKAIGLFNFSNYGLSNIPDIIDIKLNIHTSGFLILVSHTISQVYNSHNLVEFLFNKSNNNSLFESSKKLIHNVHSVYMSTENSNIKDMTIIILPLID
ncbi:serine/threonine protein phosphatase, putative [Plasmodium gallinaceum]|uniref:Serine/threonine protein phosphatase, putative n=1 Tax=Plasmodium gallinaceum TaxID=5849 RepID=A0A1J1GTA2_PLAGA|nr:serine/threonine protein phosphatase, putative [Plasmodium gallinaceum]CRG94526.1 serine/threonine protein phosphatase, putative [Plasmodium gallinaceum]